MKSRAKLSSAIDSWKLVLRLKDVNVLMDVLSACFHMTMNIITHRKGVVNSDIGGNLIAGRIGYPRRVCY